MISISCTRAISKPNFGWDNPVSLTTLNSFCPLIAAEFFKTTVSFLSSSVLSSTNGFILFAYSLASCIYFLKISLRSTEEALECFLVTLQIAFSLSSHNFSIIGFLHLSETEWTSGDIWTVSSLVVSCGNLRTCA